MNQEILKVREKIDQLDNTLIKTLEKRFTLTNKIGQIKKKNSLQIKDAKREKEIIQTNIQKSNISPKLIKKIFKEIFKESRRLQK